MLTQKNRRFLIVWFSVITFALICDLVPITGALPDVYTINKSYGNELYNGTHYVLTSGHADGSFWPFEVDYFYDGHTHNHEMPIRFFRGVFYGFDFWEFLIYGIIGLAIVFLPRIWNKK